VFPMGVPLGVVVSTRVFLDPDLGVMLWLRNADTGVEMSSFAAPGVLFRDLGRGGCVGVEFVGGTEPATLGVKGVRFEAFWAAALSVGISGREGGLSRGGMLLFPFPA